MGDPGPIRNRIIQSLRKGDTNTHKSGRRATHLRFREKCAGVGGQTGFRKMKTRFAEPGGRKQNSADRQARLSNVEGVNPKGDFEHRKQDWDQTENKPPCCGCGNKGRFKAQCPI